MYAATLLRVQEIGFLSPKPVVYVANIPIEAAPQAIDEDSGGDIDQEVTAEAAESAEAIARLALAHAQSVVDMGRDYNVPAVAACLQVRDGQEDLGAAVRSGTCSLVFRFSHVWSSQTYGIA